MTRPWDPPDADHLIESYRDGESMMSIARRYGVGDKTVRKFLLRKGVDIVNPYERVEQIPGLFERYASGESVKSLAAHFGVSRAVVVRILNQNGIVQRNRSEAMLQRMADTSPEERARLASAAHNAVRGRRHTTEHRTKIAQARERNGTGASPAELLMCEWLRDLNPVPQKAVGTYNLDLAVHPVAVEIFGGGWHSHGRHAARTAERARYILDQGWCLVVVWVEGKHRLKPGAADYVRTLHDLARRDPSLAGQYRVIWGDGKDVTALYTDLDQLALKPADERGRRNRS